jgi:hypothetical protein
MTWGREGEGWVGRWGDAGGCGCVVYGNEGQGLAAGVRGWHGPILVKRTRREAPQPPTHPPTPCASPRGACRLRPPAPAPCAAPPQRRPAPAGPPSWRWWSPPRRWWPAAAKQGCGGWQGGRPLSAHSKVDLSTRRQKCAHAPDDQQTAFNISSHNVVIDPTWATRSNPSSRSPPSRQHSTSESRYSPAAAERGGAGTGKLPYNSLSGGRTAAPFTPHSSGRHGLVGRGGGWLLSNAPAALLAAAAAAAAAGKASRGMGPLMGPARRGRSRRTPHSV